RQAARRRAGAGGRLRGRARRRRGRPRGQLRLRDRRQSRRSARGAPEARREHRRRRPRGASVIEQPQYTVEPWRVTEEHLELGLLAQSESIFALSNGHIGLRGNFDEGEPFGLPGSYLGGLFETRPLPYAEAGYGYPEDGQTVVNVTNGKIIRLLVDDAPFDVRYGELPAHTRSLDLRAGTLERVVRWRSPAGREIEVRSTRLVSFVQRSIAAIRFEVRPLDGPTRLVVQSELVANEP